MAENRVIGRDNDLPWRLPDDLKRFKALTMGHPLIMGRRTFESVGRALPGRRCIVLSRTSALSLPDGVELAPSLDDALARTAGDDVFIGGGSAVYRAALPLATCIHMTYVHAVVDGDTVFPALDMDAWAMTELETHAADERHAHPFSFRRYDRIDAPVAPR